MLALLLHRVERLAVGLAGVGAAIIIVQMLWISYGVFMRYVMANPDGTVTEATALLLTIATVGAVAQCHEFALRSSARAASLGQVSADTPGNLVAACGALGPV